MAIRKGAHPLEANLLHEIKQLGEILLRLTRMTHHQGGTQMNTWHLLSHPTNQLVGLRLRDRTTHQAQHPVTDVLQGNIHVFAHILTLTHNGQ